MELFLLFNRLTIAVVSLDLVEEGTGVCTKLTER